MRERNDAWLAEVEALEAEKRALTREAITVWRDRRGVTPASASRPLGELQRRIDSVDEKIWSLFYEDQADA